MQNFIVGTLSYYLNIPPNGLFYEQCVQFLTIIFGKIIGQVLTRVLARVFDQASVKGKKINTTCITTRCDGKHKKTTKSSTPLPFFCICF